MDLVRWRDGEIDFFTKREREKENKLRMENGFSEMARWRDRCKIKSAFPKILIIIIICNNRDNSGG